METSKLLVICPNSNCTTEGAFFLIDPENGEVLATHYCSNASFAYGDLYGNRQERQDEYTKRFGKIEVEFIDQTEIDEDTLFQKNQQFYANKIHGQNNITTD